jgi:hypothetical protein
MACVPDCGHPVALADLHTIVTCAGPGEYGGHGRCERSACGACAAGGREEEWVGEGPLRRTHDDGSEEVLQGPVEIYGFEPYTRCGGAPAGCTAQFCSDDDCLATRCDVCLRLLCNACGPVRECAAAQYGCESASCQRVECGGPYKSCEICGPLCSGCLAEHVTCCVCDKAWCLEHPACPAFSYCNNCSKFACDEHGLILEPCDKHDPRCEGEACGGPFPRCHVCGAPRCKDCHPRCGCCDNFFCAAHAAPCAACGVACCDARCAEMHPSIAGCASAAAKRARVEGGGGGGAGEGAEEAAGGGGGAGGGGAGGGGAGAPTLPVAGDMD